MIRVLTLQAPAPAESTTALGSLYESILAGGWVMVPIALCSVVALAFFLERLLALRRGRLIPRGFAEQVKGSLERSPEDALALIRGSQAAVARVLEAGLRRLDRPLPEMEKAAEDAGARVLARLSSPLRPLVVVSTITPLLGLLGTVLGMIKAFQVIAVEKAIGKPELLAEGISEALVTTAAGLIVAIPAQVAWYYLRARIERFAREVEALWHELLARFLDARDASRAA